MEKISLKIGIYVPDQDNVYLADSGNDKNAGRKVRQILDQNGWHLNAIPHARRGSIPCGLHQQPGNVPGQYAAVTGSIEGGK